jgi:hypothetical protein
VSSTLSLASFFVCTKHKEYTGKYYFFGFLSIVMPLKKHRDVLKEDAAKQEKEIQVLKRGLV